MDDIDKELAKKISPYFEIDKRASSDYLNNVQRAFVKYHAQTLKKNHGKVSEINVQTIIEDGIQGGVWDVDFTTKPFMITSQTGFVMKLNVSRERSNWNSGQRGWRTP